MSLKPEIQTSSNSKKFHAIYYTKLMQKLNKTAEIKLLQNQSFKELQKPHFKRIHSFLQHHSKKQLRFLPMPQFLAV